jgi:hypothetical protein
MGLVKSGAAVVSKSEIVFSETGSKIVAVPSDFAGGGRRGLRRLVLDGTLGLPL